MKISSSEEDHVQLFDSEKCVSEIYNVLSVRMWTSVILKVEIMLFGYYECLEEKHTSWLFGKR